MSTNDKSKGGKALKITAIITSIILLLAVVAVVSLWFYEKSYIYELCYVEAGTEVVPEDFLKKEGIDISFAEDSEEIDIHNPKEYHIILKMPVFSYQSKLVVQDTVPPVAEKVSVDIRIDEECKAEDFVCNIKDETEVKVDFKKSPDFNKAGKQFVEIELTDLANNSTVIKSELFISKLIEKFEMEVGDELPSADQFLIKPGEANYITDLSIINSKEIGEHKLIIEVDGSEFTSLLSIQDTVAPVITMQDVNSFLHVNQDPMKFVASVDDMTETKAEFKVQPDLNKTGEQEVEIVVTDAAGNQSSGKAKLTLAVDNEKPVLLGVKDIVVEVNGKISYKKNVVAKDNCMEGLELIVDSKAVNINEIGKYPVSYTARDAAGNEVSQSITVTVMPKTYSIEYVTMLADEVLAKIITPDMTQEQKAKAIFKYNQSHIGYISHSEKDSWIKAAYQGLVNHKGDCFVYFSTAKILLDRAGIKNMDIQKIPAKTNHYWHLVDVGDGWHHFDTTPRKSGHKIYMWTEAQLMEYSNKYKGSHNYDHSAYPEVP